MTEILILYILIKYDATIYKIKKLIEEKFFMFASPSLGTINPALRKLESLSCVEFESKMSDGGMLTKTYKITPFGQKYLKSLISAFKFKNKAHILNSASILICISDILEEEEKKELFQNCLNNLKILKAQIISALENPYNLYSEAQKNVIKSNIPVIESLIEEIQ